MNKHGLFANGDAHRIKELQEAIDDPKTRAIIPIRGGYGAMRLLPYLETKAMSSGPKLLIGFSDITALHSLWAKARMGSVHGAMLESIGKMDASRFREWVEIVEGREANTSWQVEVLQPGSASGRLLGGNLALLAALVGTKWALPLDETVLFIEDVNEKPYRVDRMLTTLALAGWWDRIRAVILGTFTGCEANSDGVTVEEVFQDHFSRVAIPVVSGLQVGHGPSSRDIRLGSLVAVDGQAGSVGMLKGELT